jgi:hypothetical protein
MHHQSSLFPNHKRLSPLGKIDLLLRRRNDKRIILQLTMKPRENHQLLRAWSFIRVFDETSLNEDI